MSEPIIWWPRQRATTGAAAISTTVTSGQLTDALGRKMRDLRLSVTDRCNFRCVYCMPKHVYGPHHEFLPQAELLRFEELTTVAQAFLTLGVRKIRLTGGEPLLRKELEVLVGMLAQLRTVDGSKPELAITTNGSLLTRKARQLKAAGLDRVTVSLDALDDAVFMRMNDVQVGVQEVLGGIDAAVEAGLAPIKVNMVVRKGLNDQEILPMAAYFRERGIELRLIEYMDVGSTNGWRMTEVLPSDQVRKLIHRAYPLLPSEAGKAHAETAERWTYADGKGAIGLISSVTRAFCSDCERVRLTTNGQMYLCLFASQGYDLRGLLRAGASAQELAAHIAAIWRQRQDRYSELRASMPRSKDGQRAEMSYIGG